MASLDILCFNHFNLKIKITKIEQKKIFHGLSKILKNISWPINIWLKYFLTPTKTLRPPLLHTLCMVPYGSVKVSQSRLAFWFYSLRSSKWNFWKIIIDKNILKIQKWYMNKCSLQTFMILNRCISCAQSKEAKYISIGIFSRADTMMG